MRNAPRLPYIMFLVFCLFLGGIGILSSMDAPPALEAAPAFQSTGFTSVDIDRDLTVGRNATVTGDLDVGDWATIYAQTAISLTAGATITPTGTLQALTSAAPVTTSTSSAIADGSIAGQLLILRNDNAADAITVDGAGGNVECGGNVALGAADILTLLWNGSDWNCLALRDN